MKWFPLKHEGIEVNGLPWFQDNDERLWRLPASAMDSMPAGVRTQAVAPAGARIRLATHSTSLGFRGTSVSGNASQGVDVYVDGTFWRTVNISASNNEVTCFEGCDDSLKNVSLFLPYRHELLISEIRLDAHADIHPPTPYSRKLPIVLYGSSVAQGVGAARGGMSYIAILARHFGLDFVNLGFGGAGKAEPEVVELVTDIDACCYLFDLGKSYGTQDVSAYAEMLEKVRQKRGDVPVVCMTPIFATREWYQPDYVELSDHTRRMAREAAENRIREGDQNVLLVDGLELLGPGDTDGFSADGVHPNDLGFAIIAKRLIERLNSSSQIEIKRMVL